jgi:hypothetical protein
LTSGGNAPKSILRPYLCVSLLVPSHRPGIGGLDGRANNGAKTVSGTAGVEHRFPNRGSADAAKHSAELSET